MRALTRLAACALCSGTIAVGEFPDVAATAAEMEAASRRDALEKIMAERGSEADFQLALKQARDAGVSPQAILEARFLYRVDKGDDATLARMLPEFIEQNAAFNLQDSAIFSVNEDWLSVIEYLKALSALQSDDRAAFKQHITEAFWLSPRQAAAFAPHIERLRTSEAMRDVKVDLSTSLAQVPGGKDASLEKIIGDNKALLLHFWSPWVRECDNFLPEFAAIAPQLSSQGIAVASLLPGDVPELIDEARQIIRRQGLGAAGSWLIDPAAGTLARQLRVRNLPTIVLLSHTGDVLFNGDPGDKAMWMALAKINNRIRRPASLPDDEP
jgi:hypothetical protein